MPIHKYNTHAWSFSQFLILTLYNGACWPQYLYQAQLEYYPWPVHHRHTKILSVEDVLSYKLFKWFITNIFHLPPWTSHNNFSSSPSLKGPAYAPPTSCCTSSSRLICGAWGSSKIISTFVKDFSSEIDVK